MASAGVLPTLTVIYVPDYVMPSSRITSITQLTRKVEQASPSFRINFVVSDGPFEDDIGTSSHFDTGSLAGKNRVKQISQLRTGFEVSVAKLGRNVGRLFLSLS